MLPTDSNEALSPSERRRADRKKLIIDVSYAGGDGTGIANTRDIGIGGLYMATNAPLEQGMPLQMKLVIGGSEVEFDGVVAYTDPGQGVGIRFQNLSDEHAEILKNELELE